MKKRVFCAFRAVAFVTIGVFGVSTQLCADTSNGGGCADPDPGPEYCALVYNVKVSLKTTVAKSAVTRYECEDDELVCYREPGRMNLIGYLYSCDCSCAGLINGYVTLWDKKTKNFFIYDDYLSWLVINIIGKKANKVEASWMTGPMVQPNTLAPGNGFLLSPYLLGSGFGSFDTKKRIVKNISGAVAGYGMPPFCLDVDCSDYPSGAFICDDMYSDLWAYMPTVFFGSWKMQFSSSLSKKQARDGYYIYTKFPSSSHVTSITR